MEIFSYTPFRSHYRRYSSAIWWGIEIEVEGIFMGIRKFIICNITLSIQFFINTESVIRIQNTTPYFIALAYPAFSTAFFAVIIRIVFFIITIKFKMDFVFFFVKKTSMVKNSYIITFIVVPVFFSTTKIIIIIHSGIPVYSQSVIKKEITWKLNQKIMIRFRNNTISIIYICFNLHIFNYCLTICNNLCVQCSPQFFCKQPVFIFP